MRIKCRRAGRWRELSKASVEEHQRLLSPKQVVAAQSNGLPLVLPGPRAVGRVNKNLEMAQHIHGWSYGVLIYLEYITTELRHAK